MVVVNNPEQSLDLSNALSVVRVGNPKALDAGGSIDESQGHGFDHFAAPQCCP